MRETNAIGLSSPFGILWANTAPTPCGDALQMTKLGFVGSKCTATFDVESALNYLIGNGEFSSITGTKLQLLVIQTLLTKVSVQKLNDCMKHLRYCNTKNLKV